MPVWDRTWSQCVNEVFFLEPMMFLLRFGKEWLVPMGSTLVPASNLIFARFQDERAVVQFYEAVQNSWPMPYSGSTHVRLK